ncbi:aldehyde dehydrogenase [Oceanobacillus halotolerans]|uniref:aldehyde dehydrogenase n=1 Tax=Oceanobacillus halotolerans TaxID=2663380 RepID=UPI0013DB6A1C|nr:aldehyde dehydrogenase [Oceanobacillus halotolerans]
MSHLRELVSSQHAFFLSGKTLDYSYRRKQLFALREMLKNYEKKVYQALKKDLNKSAYEALTTEIGFLYQEIDHTIKYLKKWMKPEKVDAPATHKGSRSVIYHEPYGVTLIISPWNYPVHLAIAPAIGAIAAGNTVIIKPSEYTHTTSKLLHEMIADTFDPAYIAVVEGGKEVSEQLLQEQLNYVFFTGSSAIGQKVMEQASKQLTPVTLELGGKSPVIVDQDANIDLAAKRIVWGKFTNAGQTCVAPDYVYVHDKVKKPFLKALKKYCKTFYGKTPLENEDYTHIVHEKHFQRLAAFLSNGDIVYGGRTNKNKLIIEPTILDQISWEDPIMKEEIFGPLLPILSFTNLDGVIHTLQSKDKPLALYYFGDKKKRQNKVLKHVSFGGGCINDTLYHLANPHLPFGGVGNSGIGSYHGKYSFETFSHRKSVLIQTTKFDLPFRYPGSKLLFSVIKQIMK